MHYLILIKGINSVKTEGYTKYNSTARHDRTKEILIPNSLFSSKKISEPPKSLPEKLRLKNPSLRL